MQIISLPIGAIVPYARNPRHNTTAIDKVAASIKEFGFRQPIVVDKENVIIVGHTRLLAAKKLNLQEVPVHVAENLTPAQIKAYRLADNRTHEEATWDKALLGLELNELSDLNFDLPLTGFETTEINKLLETSQTGLTDEDACPDISKTPVTKPGDVWLLGQHRLMCGDSTQMHAVEMLMAEGKADLVFTDPPYNVNYQGYTDKKLKIKNDDMDTANFVQFLMDAFATQFTVLKPGASLYVCHSSMYQREFQQALEANHFAVRTQIIWAKNHFAWGHARYKYQHEPIFYCHQQDQSDPWYGDKSQSTLWHVDKPAVNDLHPTMKPVALAEIALKNSSKSGDIVMDLFAGSGSTLIACEKLGRIARLMELDPHYCDVIIQRWQDYTGQPARLQSTQQIYTDIAAASIKKTPA